MIYEVAGLLTLPVVLLAQLAARVPEKLTEGFPKPKFVLHDDKLKLEKPRTAFGPLSSDGKGHTTGTFAVYGGSSLIQVLSLSFNSAGTLLAIGSTPDLVDIWDVEKRKKLRSFLGGTVVALSPDGRLLAKDGNGLEIINVSSGKLELKIKWTGREVRRLSFDPAGKWLLVSANGEDDRIFDLSNGQLLAQLGDTRGSSFSPDGSLVIGGDYQHLTTWSTRDWKSIRNLPNGPDYVTAVAAYPQKNLEVVGGPHSARLLSLDSGKQVAQLGDGYTIFASFDQAGSLIFTYASTGFGIWDTKGKQYCSQPNLGNGTVALSFDGRWLAAAPVNQATDVMIWSLPEILKACSVDTAAAEH